ncbi:hypothetical protein PENTCL1PPCAC_29649, partial [Pristionchus entomophagus]
QLLFGCLLFATTIATLIPREKLFSDSNNAEGVALSPDGKFLGFITPDANKIRNVYTWRISDRQKRQVTFEKGDVMGFVWTGVPDIIIFSADPNGNENTMLFKKNISEMACPLKRKIISNKPGVQALIVANNKSGRFVLIGMNDVTPAYHNVYKFDLITNKLLLVFNNTRFAVQMIHADNDMRIRIAEAQQSDGTKTYFRVSSKANPLNLTSSTNDWEEYASVKPEDIAITGLVGCDTTNENIYWIWGESIDLGQLIITPLHNITKRTVLHNATQAELERGSFQFHPKDRSLLMFSEYRHYPKIVAFNDTIRKDLQYLQNFRPNDHLQIIDMSDDMRTWLVTYLSSENPHDIIIYHRDSMSTELLFNRTPDLKGYRGLITKIGFDFAARDGLIIQSYLSLPPDVPLKNTTNVPATDRSFAEQKMIPTKPQKMVVVVHGGPESRDHYNFEPTITLLTSRGYAVMQVNFRGSSGFGKRLTNAGYGEWSKKMHYDLLDAVDFAVSKGIANRSATAIMGASYGGYATLVGLTFSPDAFACGIDVFGPSNLVSLLDSVPAYWTEGRKDLVKMIGANTDTEKGRKDLISKSPFFIADRVKKPLMIIQGANDARVKEAESEQFVDALKNHSIPVTYVLYPDEGHGIRRGPNVLASLGFIEKFFHGCLRGDYQPFTSGQYNESAIVKSDGFAPAVQQKQQ